MMAASSRSRSPGTLARRSAAATFIDVRGVLNSWARASSIVARSPPLRRAASALAAASWPRARSEAYRRQVGDRLDERVGQAGVRERQCPDRRASQADGDEDHRALLQKRPGAPHLRSFGSSGDTRSAQPRTCCRRGGRRPRPTETRIGDVSRDGACHGPDDPAEPTGPGSVRRAARDRAGAPRLPPSAAVPDPMADWRRFPSRESQPTRPSSAGRRW